MIMMKSDLTPGMRFRFKTDPENSKGETFTVQAVSEFVDMIKIKENGFWVGIDNIVLITEDV